MQDMSPYTFIYISEHIASIVCNANHGTQPQNYHHYIFHDNQTHAGHWQTDEDFLH